MSGANAIHGVVIIGAIIVMGKAETDNYLALGLGFFAVILGTLNVVGWFCGNRPYAGNDLRRRNNYTN